MAASTGARRDCGVKLRVLALDYDGTIAVDGRLDPAVRAAIEELRAQGLVVVLVTGRILSELRALLGGLRLFDAVVAENGAMTTFPGAGRSTRHAPRCSPALLEALRARGLEVRAGVSVVELDAAAAHVALEVVRELELPLTLHFNKGRLMVLPPAVSKATGLREALRALRLSPHNAIGVGDAENDHELLAVCEIGAAVAWGSASLRAAADVVVPGAGPAAVADYLRALAAGPRVLSPPVARRHLVLGRDEHGELVSLALRGRNVLIVGDPCTGKSWVAGLLCEQLILQGYCVCLIDPEGDYEALESLPGVLLLGGDEPPPSLGELARTLRHADVSVIVDLARMKLPHKRAYVVRALRMLAELRRRTGLPHHVVVDEAHYFLDDPREVGLLDAELMGYTLITYRASSLRANVLDPSGCVVVTRLTDEGEARLLHDACRADEDPVRWRAILAGLELDEACLLPGSEESRGTLRRFRLAPRLTHHVRHRHKYLDVPVDTKLAFRFVRDDGSAGPVARSLQELVDALGAGSTGDVGQHVRRGDFSRWIEDVFRDGTLAARVRDLERAHRLGRLADFNGATAQAVRERYDVGDDLL